jgi:hypothetical protein
VHGQIAEDNQKATFSEFRRLASLSFEEGQKEAKRKKVMQQLPRLFTQEQLTEVLLQYFICYCTVVDEEEEEEKEKANAKEKEKEKQQKAKAKEKETQVPVPARDLRVPLDHGSPLLKAALGVPVQPQIIHTESANTIIKQIGDSGSMEAYMFEDDPEPDADEDKANLWAFGKTVARDRGKGSAAAPTLEDVQRRDKQLKNPPSKVQKELKGDIAKVWWHSGGRQ